MKFGYFDGQQREYAITTPKTPLPWINYLGCNEFFSLISNTCGGCRFNDDPLWLIAGTSAYVRSDHFNGTFKALTRWRRICRTLRVNAYAGIFCHNNPWASIVVDGTPIDGCIIPYEAGKTDYHVTVTMG